jgi:hypothetical protein
MEDPIHINGLVTNKNFAAENTRNAISSEILDTTQLFKQKKPANTGFIIPIMIEELKEDLISSP